MWSLLSGRDQIPLAVCSSKWAPHPSFDASVNICRACFRGCNGWPSNTLLSSSHHLRWGWRDLGTGITFSSCFSSATVWVSCVVALSGPAFLLLWVDLWGTWIVGLGKPDPTVWIWSCLSRSANVLLLVWPCPLSGRTGNLWSWRPVWGPVLIFPCSPATLVPDKVWPGFEYARDKCRG